MLTIRRCAISASFYKQAPCAEGGCTAFIARFGSTVGAASALAGAQLGEHTDAILAEGLGTTGGNRR